MTPTADRPTIWDRDPKPTKNDRLVPFYTEIAYQAGRVVALNRAYRVVVPLEYHRARGTRPGRS